MIFSSPVWRTLIDKCQRALYHSRSEANFCDEFCSALVASGHFAAVWVVLNGNDQEQGPRIMACAGLDPQDCASFPRLENRLDGLEGGGHFVICAQNENIFDADARAWLELITQTLIFGIQEQRRRAEIAQEMESYKVTVDRLVQQIFAVDQHAIISIADKAGVILYANEKFCEVSQYSYEELVGNKHSIVNSGYHSADFFTRMWRTIGTGKIWHGEIRNRRKNGELYWVDSTIVPFPSPDGKGWHYVGVRTEITALKRLEEDMLMANEQLERRVAERTQELEADIKARHAVEMKLQQEQEEQRKLIAELHNAQGQLLQSEKMASIGQLAAGVAHEINNPIGYVYSNLGSLEKYMKDVFSMLEVFETAESEFSPESAGLSRIQAHKETVDLSFLKEDIPTLMAESKEGITRVKKIVQDLKDFSHVDEAEWQSCDLHHGLDSTLNIVWNELKYKAEVVKEYGDLPDVECIPSQLNQVFMNLLVNAGHAIESRGTIIIRTGREETQVWVEIADTGKGIDAANLKRIFEPFFTTKPVGKGTGLGLSLSYGIVTNHHGRIEVDSTPGVGTTFRVWLPLKQVEKI